MNRLSIRVTLAAAGLLSACAAPRDWADEDAWVSPTVDAQIYENQPETGPGGAGGTGGVGGTGGAGGQGGTGGTGGAGGQGGTGGAGGTGGTGGSPEACPDLDQDGYQDVLCNPDPENGGGDCDDTNNLINPGRNQNCGSFVDTNCDGLVPPLDPQCPGECPDVDGDGYEDRNCNPLPENGGGDCDDTDPNVNPGMREICGNGKDDDCFGGDIPCFENCIDEDGDGFGVGAGCLGPDCDDTNPRINPWMTEICGDGIDQDCNGVDRTCAANCIDLDGDGFGVGPGCLGPDCNDHDPNINPGAREIPGDGIDQDCDGEDLILQPDCLDRDQDGYGDGPGCKGPDCDDNNPRVNPGRMEICGNGLDDDCSGGDQPCVQIGVGECIDADGDGYGQGGCPLGNFDCNDQSADINPGAEEICDGIDNNCDGRIDECPIAGQICDRGACIGGPGASCRNDDGCAVGQGLFCEASTGRCRARVGTACDADDHCEVTAQCEVQGACGVGQRCYQTKGATCTGDCSCSDGLLCHGQDRRCVECAQDRDCAGPRDTCTPGGLCAELVSVGGNGKDARLQALKRLAACWESFGSSRTDHACDIWMTESPFLVQGSSVNQLGPESDTLKDYVCDLRAGSDVSSDERSALRDIFGCALMDLRNIWWHERVTPDTIGDYCVYFVARKSGFGFPNDTRPAIVVSNCDENHFD